MRQNGNEDDWSADSDPDSPLGSSDFVSTFTLNRKVNAHFQYWRPTKLLVVKMARFPLII